MSPDCAGTSKISWIASFKPKSSWSEDNSFTTAGVYLSEHRLCSFFDVFPLFLAVTLFAGSGRQHDSPPGRSQTPRSSTLSCYVKLFDFGF